MLPSPIYLPSYRGFDALFRPCQAKDHGVLLASAGSNNHLTWRLFLILPFSLFQPMLHHDQFSSVVYRLMLSQVDLIFFILSVNIHSQMLFINGENVLITCLSLWSFSAFSYSTKVLFISTSNKQVPIRKV